MVFFDEGLVEAPIYEHRLLVAGNKLTGPAIIEGANTTLPIWIFGNIRLGQQLPQVNVVVLFVILLSLIPVALAQRLTRDTGVLRAAAAPVPAAAVGAGT